MNYLKSLQYTKYAKMQIPIITVLLIETSLKDAALIENTLPRESFKLYHRSCMQYALDFLQHDSTYIDIIISNLKLLHYTELKTIATLYEVVGAKIPIVAITSSFTETLKLDIINAGARDLWVKEFILTNNSWFSSAINNTVLHHRSLRDALQIERQRKVKDSLMKLNTSLAHLAR